MLTGLMFAAYLQGYLAFASCLQTYTVFFFRDQASLAVMFAAADCKQLGEAKKGQVFGGFRSKGRDRSPHLAIKPVGGATHAKHV
jgi:hypothetical protein